MINLREKNLCNRNKRIVEESKDDSRGLSSGLLVTNGSIVTNYPLAGNCYIPI